MIDLNAMKRPVIVKKPSGTIAVADNMSLLQRKFYDAFLFIAKQSLSKDNSKIQFKTDLKALKSFFGLEKDKNNMQYNRIIDALMKTIIEYNVLGKDKIVKGKFSALPWTEIIKDIKTKTTIVKFELPTPVRESMLRKDGMYANISLVVVSGLRSKYSIILYELCKDYERVQIPLMPIEKFRNIFGLYRIGKDGKREEKYGKTADLRMKVLDVAVKELNKNKNIDFKVSYELFKTGTKYTSIKFHIKPKPKASLSFQTSPQIQSVSYQDNSVSALIDLIPAEHITAAIKKMIIKSAKEKGMEYVQRNIQYTINSRPANFAAYLSTALKENYGEKSESKLIFEAKAKEEKVKDIAEENKKKEKYEKYKKQYEELSDEKIESLIYKVAVHSHLIRKQIKNGITAELRENSIVKARIISEMIKNGNAKSGSDKNKKAADDQEIRNQKKLDEALGKL